MPGVPAGPVRTRGRHGADLERVDRGDRSFIAWYKGTQTDTAKMYSCGVPIFGDASASVYMGLGLENGHVALCNDDGGGEGKKQVEGTTPVADGAWHMLAWVLHSGGGSANDATRCFKLYADPGGVVTEEASIDYKSLD